MAVLLPTVQEDKSLEDAVTNRSPRLLVVLASTLVACVGLPAHGDDCTYVAVQTASNPYPELDQRKDCGEVRGDELELSSDHLIRLWLNDKGLGVVYIGGGVFYVNREGRSVRTLSYDSGADYFEEGLARGVSFGKIGFVDHSLEFVIAPAFDFAFPFSGGYAVVCNGCVRTDDREHATREGGSWGVIDKKGEVVVRIAFGKSELKSAPAYLKLKQ